MRHRTAVGKCSEVQLCARRHTCTHPQANTLLPLSPFWLCVLFMRFYVFSLLLSLGLSAELAPQGMQKEDKHGLMWSNFLPSKNEAKRKKSLKKRRHESQMQNVITSSVMFKRTLSLRRFPLQTWGIIRRVIFH